VSVKNVRAEPYIKYIVHIVTDGVTVGALATRSGWVDNGAVQVGQKSVGGVPTNMQGMARCPQ
jgi:hypothetical protein